MSDKIFCENGQRGKKRKRKSFLQKQKKFVKSGGYGGVSELDAQITPEFYDYFLEIMKIINSKKHDVEEFSILASNVLQELKGKETVYCCNQIISRIVENLLPYSSDEELSLFLENFSKNLRPIFSNPFGSHVLQATLIAAFEKYEKNNFKQSDNESSATFCNYILKVSNFLLNNLDDFIWDVYSNAVGRTVLNVLSGQPVKGEINLNSKNASQKEVPENFDFILKKFFNKILSWPQLASICNQPVNSNFLQSLLIASRKFDEFPELIKKIIDVYKNAPMDLTLEKNIPFVRLIEVSLAVCKRNQFKEIHKLIFQDKLPELATSKCGNFSVQKLILNCDDEELFEKIFSKLMPHMESIICEKYFGVLLAVVKQCRKLEKLQADCLAMLMKIFHIENPLNIVPIISSLTSAEKYQPDFENATLHGTLIIEELFYFKKPIKVVNSYINLPLPKLLKLMSDIKGSHLTDAFVKSKTIGEKSRTKLFKKLQKNFFTLATSKYGSRSLDAIWSVISIQQKIYLAEELRVQHSDLCNNIYGRGFAWKIHLTNYCRNKEEWIKILKTSESAKKNFSDIISQLKTN